MQITPDMAGCWIEGHRGVYGIVYLIEIAQSFGFESNLPVDELLAAYGNNEDTYETLAETFDVYESVGWLADESEDYLNTLAPEGYLFGWYDGEFFLWPVEDWTNDVG